MLVINASFEKNMASRGKTIPRELISISFRELFLTHMRANFDVSSSHLIITKAIKAHRSSMDADYGFSVNIENNNPPQKPY